MVSPLFFGSFYSHCCFNMTRTGKHLGHSQNNATVTGTLPRQSLLGTKVCMGEVSPGIHGAWEPLFLHPDLKEALQSSLDSCPRPAWLPCDLGAPAPVGGGTIWTIEIWGLGPPPSGRKGTGPFRERLWRHLDPQALCGKGHSSLTCGQCLSWSQAQCLKNMKWFWTTQRSHICGACAAFFEE